MVELSFDGLPSYTYLGGEVAGTLLLAVERPTRGTDLTLTLRGREFAQIHVQQGKNSIAVQQSVPLVELAYDFRDKLQFVDSGHLAPGEYRLPFEFTIPPTALPTLHTTPGPPAWSGTLGAHPDGMFVEYELEARLNVPLWLDRKVQAVLPVYSPRRVLGVVPKMTSQPNPGSPALDITPIGVGPLLPGTPFRAIYQVRNPSGKEIRRLTFTLKRHVEFRVQGRARSSDGPAFAVDVALDVGPVVSGTLELPIPNAEPVIGPEEGSLFREYWIATATLDVPWGFDTVVAAPLIPA